MNNDIDIIKIALEYYDKHSQKYDDIIKDVDSVNFHKAQNDLEYNKITLYNKNNKLLFEGKYEIMGAYYPNTQIWIWGWALSKLNKSYVKTIKNIFDYGIQLNPDIPSNYFLKLELLTSRLKISDEIQLEIYTSLASYLSKNSFIYKYNPSEDGENIIYYLFITV